MLVPGAKNYCHVSNPVEMIGAMTIPRTHTSKKILGSKRDRLDDDGITHIPNTSFDHFEKKGAALERVRTRKNWRACGIVLWKKTLHAFNKDGEEIKAWHPFGSFS
jgi:hypothetical protein